MKSSLKVDNKSDPDTTADELKDLEGAHVVADDDGNSHIYFEDAGRHGLPARKNVEVTRPMMVLSVDGDLAPQATSTTRVPL